MGVFFLGMGYVYLTLALLLLCYSLSQWLVDFSCLGLRVLYSAFLNLILVLFVSFVTVTATFSYSLYCYMHLNSACFVLSCDMPIVRFSLFGTSNTGADLAPRQILASTTVLCSTPTTSSLSQELIAQ